MHLLHNIINTFLDSRQVSHCFSAIGLVPTFITNIFNFGQFQEFGNCQIMFVLLIPLLILQVFITFLDARMVLMYRLGHKFQYIGEINIDIFDRFLLCCHHATAS